MTKTLSVFIVLMVALVSCKPKNEFAEPIKEHVIKVAGGMDIKYKPVSYDVLDTVTNAETIEEFWNNFPEKFDNDKDREAGMALMREKIIEWKADETMQDAYKVWSFYVSEYDDAKKGKPEDVDYYVVKHVFNAVNPIIKTDMTIYRYYLIDSKYNIITFVDNATWDDYKAKYKGGINLYNYMQFEKIYSN